MDENQGKKKNPLLRLLACLVTAALLLTALLGGLIVWFTFFPPETALFADLGGAVRTFLTIPV